MNYVQWETYICVCFSTTDVAVVNLSGTSTAPSPKTGLHSNELHVVMIA